MKQNLDEISLIRLVLIIVLVLYHSFAPWCEAWRPFVGYTVSEAYWWIGTLSYSFMLPAFVFMSGYIYAFQRETLLRNSFKSLVVGKIKRLYVPSIIFSVLYLMLITAFDVDFKKNIKSILEGVGHMWFLPMLFWCFIFMHILLNIKERYLKTANYHLSCHFQCGLITFANETVVFLPFVFLHRICVLSCKRYDKTLGHKSEHNNLLGCILVFVYCSDPCH